MKYFEVLVSIDKPNGTQIAWAYVNAKNKTEAKKKIKEACPFLKIIDDQINEYPENENSKIGDKVRLWYFEDVTVPGTWPCKMVEHHEEY